MSGFGFGFGVRLLPGIKKSILEESLGGGLLRLKCGVMHDVGCMHVASRMDDAGGALTNAPFRLGHAHAHTEGALRGVLAVQILVGSLDDGLLVRQARHLEAVSVGPREASVRAGKTALVSNRTGRMVALGNDASVVANVPARHVVLGNATPKC